MQFKRNSRKMQTGVLQGSRNLWGPKSSDLKASFMRLILKNAQFACKLGHSSKCSNRIFCRNASFSAAITKTSKNFSDYFRSKPPPEWTAFDAMWNDASVQKQESVRAELAELEKLDWHTLSLEQMHNSKACIPFKPFDLFSFLFAKYSWTKFTRRNMDLRLRLLFDVVNQ